MAAPSRQAEAHPVRVLVVDDEPLVADLLREVLRGEGYDVETAGDGTRALERLSQRDYDVILSDVRMPRLDGPGLYRALERERPEVLPRFLFMSAHAAEGDAALEPTGAPVLPKPFRLAAVLEAVRSVAEAAVAR